MILHGPFQIPSPTKSKIPKFHILQRGRRCYISRVFDILALKCQRITFKSISHNINAHVMANIKAYPLTFESEDIKDAWDIISPPALENMKLCNLWFGWRCLIILLIAPWWNSYAAFPWRPECKTPLVLKIVEAEWVLTMPLVHT